MNKIAPHFRPLGQLRPGLMVLLTLVTLSSYVFSQSTPAPRLIPFQGRLTNQTGIAYDNGQYTITFNLYSLAIGGSTVWTERHEKVSVIGGMVNLFLGSINTITPVDFSTTKYLGITVDADNNPATADPEMVPRTMIVTSFHAKQAENSTTLAGNDWTSFVVDGAGVASNNPGAGFVNGARIYPASVSTSQLADSSVQNAQIQDSAVNSAKIADNAINSSDLSPELRQASIIPPGSIMPFAGPSTNIPVGWRLCDGSALRNTDFSSLFAAIGTSWGNGTTSPAGAQNPAQAGVTNFNLPDLRGMFLRGVNGARNDSFSDSSPSRILGSLQSSAVGNHVHGIDTATPNGSLTARVIANDNGNVHADHRDVSGWSSNYHVSDAARIGVFYTFPNDLAPKGAVVVGATAANSTATTETRPSNAAVNYMIKL